MSEITEIPSMPKAPAKASKKRKSTRKKAAPRKKVVARPVRKAIESGAERTLDAQQEVIGLIRKQGYLVVDGLGEVARGGVRAFPRTFVRVSGEAVENMIATQTVLLDSASAYTHETKKLFSGKRSGRIPKTVLKYMEKAVDSGVDTQKRVLDAANDRTKSVVKRLAPKKKSAGKKKEGDWAVLAREGIDRLTDAQLSGVEFTRKVARQLLVS